MTVRPDNPPSAQLKKFSQKAGESFRTLRDTVMSAGPLDHTTCELIVLSSLAVCGLEQSFKIHALRARKSGIDRPSLQHAVAVTLGAATPISRVTEALEWLEEVEQHMQGQK